MDWYRTTLNWNLLICSYTENFFRVNWLKNWVMFSQFWPIYVESLWLILKKRVSLTQKNWVRLTQIPPWLSYWVSWLEKNSIVSGDSVFGSIDSKTESLSNLSQPDSVLWWLINWLENWVTRKNAHFSSQLDSITKSWWNLSQSDSVFLGQTDSFFFLNESKWLDVYGSKLGQHDSIFESLWLGKNSQCALLVYLYTLIHFLVCTLWLVSRNI